MPINSNVNPQYHQQQQRKDIAKDYFTTEKEGMKELKKQKRVLE